MVRAFVAIKNTAVEKFNTKELILIPKGTTIEFDEETGIFRYAEDKSRLDMMPPDNFIELFREITPDSNSGTRDWYDFRNETAKLVLASLLTDRGYMSEDYASVRDKKGVSPQDRAALMAISYANSLVEQLKSHPL